MCFTADYDWLPDVSDDGSDIATTGEQIECCECRRCIQTGETYHWCEMREHEACQACDDEDHECKHEYGESWSGKWCNATVR